MIRIENYSDQYFLDVVKLVENFHKEAVGEYDELFEPASLIETIKNNNPKHCFLLIVDNVCQGIIFGIVVKSMISERYMFQEVIWYVNESFRKYGVKLLKETEKVLKSTGISVMMMAVLENSKTAKLKRFYERLGFKPIETHFIRNL